MSEELYESLPDGTVMPIDIDEGDPVPYDYDPSEAERLIRKTTAIKNQSANIAPTEFAPTASRPYSAGDYFFLDGIFCKAKAAIAQGSRFTKDTNYEEKILAVELAALNQ